MTDRDAPHQATPPTLKPHQVDALRSLAKDPTGWSIPAATKSFLRKRGLVGHDGGFSKGGQYQRTTSPLTDAGRAYLAEVKS